MAQHQNSGAKHCRWIGHIFAGDIGCRAVHCFEHGALVSEICAGNQTESTNKRRAQVGDDVAIEVFQQQHVVLVRVHHQLHTGVVHNVLAVSNLRIFSGDIARAADEQPVRELHDIGFVNSVDLLTLEAACIFKRKAGDAGRGLLSDDLQTFNHAGNDLVLDARVQAFGIFSNDDEVNPRVTGGNAGKIDDGTEVGEQLELLTQRDVDAGEAAA